MGHGSQDKVLNYEESKDTDNFNDVQEEKEYVLNEYTVLAIVSQDVEEEHEEEKFHIQSGCLLIKICSKM